MQILAGHVGFLRHIMSKDGLLVDLTKIETAVNWTSPKNKIEVRSFLGLVITGGWSRDFQ